MKAERFSDVHIFTECAAAKRRSSACRLISVSRQWRTILYLVYSIIRLGQAQATTKQDVVPTSHTETRANRPQLRRCLSRLVAMVKEELELGYGSPGCVPLACSKYSAIEARCSARA